MNTSQYQNNLIGPVSWPPTSTTFNLTHYLAAITIFFSHPSRMSLFLLNLPRRLQNLLNSP